jgi:hypothetical protein
VPIIRGHHEFDDFFTRIPNDWVRDKRLSLKAIGLLVQLLSHAPGWRVSIQTLANANSCGVDLIRAAVKELINAGYIRRRQERVDTRFGEAVYETCDPSLGFPITGKPSSENPTPKKNIVKKNIEKNVYADDLFETFWATYPRKVGRQAAYKAFLTLLVTNDPAIIVAGCAAYAQDPNLPPKQFVPYPATWLNRYGWLDEALPHRELTADQKQEREQEAITQRRERDQALSEELRKLDREAKDNAAPIPICKHGKSLPRCLPCCRDLAKGENNDTI